MAANGRVPALGTFEATLETAEEVCRRYASPTVLDVGCGAGRLLVSLAPLLSRGFGVDISPEAIREARLRAQGRRNLSFHVSPVEDLPSSLPASLDVILFVGSLEHMADPGAALSAARERAHPDSRIIVVAVSPRAPHAVLSRWMLQRSSNPVVAHLGAEGVGRVAGEVGLRVEEVRPLYRGSRRTGSRALGSALTAYDRLGGPTSAVVLRPAGGGAATRDGEAAPGESSDSGRREHRP